MFAAVPNPAEFFVEGRVCWALTHHLSDFAKVLRSSKSSGLSHLATMQHLMRPTPFPGHSRHISMRRFSDSSLSSQSRNGDTQTACKDPSLPSCPPHALIGRSMLTATRQISTNGGRGATKSGLRHRDHAIAYTSAIPPPPLPNEMLSKDAIRILPVNQTEKLDDTSRINLVKVYPVEHNVKLCEVGMVAPEDIRKLRTYYKNGLRNELSGRDG